MAKKYIRPPTRSSARASSSDGDGNHIRNENCLACRVVNKKSCCQSSNLSA